MRWHNFFFSNDFYVKKKREDFWVFANHPTMHSGIVSKGGPVSTPVLPTVLASITSLTPSLTTRQTIFLDNICIYIYFFWSTFFVGQNYFWQTNYWPKIVLGWTNFCLKTVLAKIKFCNKKLSNKKNVCLKRFFVKKNWSKE